IKVSGRHVSHLYSGCGPSSMRQLANVLMHSPPWIHANICPTAWSRLRNYTTTGVAQSSDALSVPAAVVPSAHPTQRNWDWGWVVGQKASRRPAIKKPARHQWHFCNPNYDKHQPLPAKMLPPHAPPSAERLDEWKLFKQLSANHRQGSTRRYITQFRRWLALRDVDWKVAFEQAVAADTKVLKLEARREARRRREASWQDYKLKLVQAAVSASPVEATQHAQATPSQ
ncbi:hypothetical protein QJQ45_026271, partial [Haematococcus lacustris]